MREKSLDGYQVIIFDKHVAQNPAKSIDEWMILFYGM